MKKPGCKRKYKCPDVKFTMTKDEEFEFINNRNRIAKRLADEYGCAIGCKAVFDAADKSARIEFELKKALEAQKEWFYKTIICGEINEKKPKRKR